MPNISSSRGNRTMKFGQLIECNMGNIFLEKSYTKCDEGTSPRPFPEKLNWRHIWINSLRFLLYAKFLLHAKLKAVETYWIQGADHFLLTHTKLFWKIKRGLGLASLPHFLHNFWRKIFILLYSINWPNFIGWLSLLCEILVNMCIAIVC